MVVYTPAAIPLFPPPNLTYFPPLSPHVHTHWPATNPVYALYLAQPVSLVPGMTLEDVARALSIKPRRLCRLYNEVEGGRHDEKHGTCRGSHTNNPGATLILPQYRRHYCVAAVWDVTLILFPLSSRRVAGIRSHCGHGNGGAHCQ